jgi:hypothetical protein
LSSENGQNVGEIFHNISSNLVIQKTVVSATIISGLTTALDILPKVLGLVAVLIGISVSLLVRKKIKLELEILEKKKDEDELAD